MIQLFADEYPSVQTYCGQTAIDDGRRDRRRGDRLAGTAGILRANVAMHKEARRFAIELFAHVFADLDQIMTALAAGA